MSTNHSALIAPVRMPPVAADLLFLTSRAKVGGQVPSDAGEQVASGRCCREDSRPGAFEDACLRMRVQRNPRRDGGLETARLEIRMVLRDTPVPQRGLGPPLS